MCEDIHVHCTECKHCKLDNIGHTHCGYESECYAWDPEDSRPLSERPKFEQSIRKSDNMGKIIMPAYWDCATKNN